MHFLEWYEMSRMWTNKIVVCVVKYDSEES